MEKINQVSIRLVKERPLLSEEQLTSPEKVAMVVGDYIRDMDREALCVINFNSKLQPLNFNLVSIGAIDTTIASPREILKSAILSNAANMMILHNHPSNILEPSKEDIRTTAKLVDICNLVGIPLLDHIIVGPDKGRYFSLRDKQLVDFRKSSTYSDKLEFLNFKKEKDIDIAYIILQKEGGYMSSDKRDITKLIRFNDREYQIVKENANACNMNFSAYVRYAISNIKMPNPDMRKHILKLINEVNHIGNNVNQIVRNNNSGLYMDSDKTRLMEYMRLLNLKVGAFMEKYGD